jgi:hypothetical protein
MSKANLKSVASGSKQIHVDRANSQKTTEKLWLTANPSVQYNGTLLKCELRHAPMANTEQVRVWSEMTVQNNGAVPVEMLDPIPNSFETIRLRINGKEVYDKDRSEGRNHYVYRLCSKFQDKKERDNYYYKSTGVTPAYDATGALNGVTVPAGGSVTFISDWSINVDDSFGAGLPMERITLQELEMKTATNGFNVCNPQAAISDLQINNIKFYSLWKHRSDSIPRGMYSLYIPRFDQFVIPAGSHGLTAISTYRHQLHTSHPIKSHIIACFVYVSDNSDPDAYKTFDSSWVKKLNILESGRDDFKYRYEDERKIFYQADKFYKHRHNVHLPRNPTDGSRTGILDCLVDLSHQFESANHGHEGANSNSNVVISGYSNINNLILEVSNSVPLSATSDLHFLLFYPEISKISPNGAVNKVIM